MRRAFKGGLNRRGAKAPPSIPMPHRGSTLEFACRSWLKVKVPNGRKFFWRALLQNDLLS
jgi:hypothetical protein